MNQRVKLVDGIIYQSADADGLSAKTLLQDLDVLLVIQKDLQQKKEPFLLVYDASSAKWAGPDVRAQALYNLSRLKYDKMAVFGIKTVYLKYMARFVIAGIGKSKKIKIFGTKKDAERWLKEGR